MTLDVYIHIGRPKTGTTAIQNYLFNHRQELLHSGVLYPDCGILDNAQHLIAVSLLQDLPDSIAHLPRQDPRRLQDELLGQIEKYKPVKIILSSEFFSLMTPEKSGRLKTSLKSFFNGLPVRIISYFRAQADYLESSYSQEIKNTGMKRPVDFDTFRESFLARKVNDYYWSCNNWAAVFGKENIIIRPFETDQLLNGDVVADFLNILDVIPLSTEYRPDRKVNTSLSVPRMMLMNSLAELDINADGKKQLTSAILKIPELPSEAGKYRLLDSWTATEIEHRFSDSNARLAKEYSYAKSEKFFRNKKVLSEIKEYKKAEFSFLYEITRSIYENDKNSFQILEGAIKNNSRNKSLDVLRGLMEKRHSLLTGIHYCLVRIIDRLQ